MILSDVKNIEIPDEGDHRRLRAQRRAVVPVGIEFLIGGVEPGRCEQAAGSDSQSALAVRESVGDGEGAGPSCALIICGTPICGVAGDVDAVPVGSVGIYVNKF